MIHCYIEKKSFTLNGFRHAIPIVKYHKNATFLQTKKPTYFSKDKSSRFSVANF